MVSEKNENNNRGEGDVWEEDWDNNNNNFKGGNDCWKKGAVRTIIGGIVVGLSLAHRNALLRDLVAQTKKTHAD